jgi:hypothetical protein
MSKFLLTISCLITIEVDGADHYHELRGAAFLRLSITLAKNWPLKVVMWIWRRASDETACSLRHSTLFLSFVVFSLPLSDVYVNTDSLRFRLFSSMHILWHYLWHSSPTDSWHDSRKPPSRYTYHLSRMPGAVDSLVRQCLFQPARRRLSISLYSPAGDTSNG